MLNASTGMPSASFLPAQPLCWNGDVQSKSFVVPTMFPARTETVQRRSSRPSSLISSDSLLAVRLQQEEFWKSRKPNHPKSVPSADVFAAPASIAGKNPRFLQGKIAFKPALSDHPIVTGMKFPISNVGDLNFKSSAPPLLHSQKSRRKPRKAADDWPALIPQKAVYHERLMTNSIYIVCATHLNAKMHNIGCVLPQYQCLLQFPRELSFFLRRGFQRRGSSHAHKRVSHL